MTQSTAAQMRQWKGPAIFSFGFRPLFLLATAWAAIAMILWIAMLTGIVDLPTRVDPVSWHAHEFLFGYLGAVVAGFLLTAVPNWTGRMPVVGWPLAGLVLLWLIGRIAFATSMWMPPWVGIAADLLFPAVLWLVILREILAGKNWRNLPILALVGVLMLANLLFHVEAAYGEVAAQGFGLRLGLSVILMLISLVGGRIIPSFTRNWLVKQGQTILPVPPMQRFDKAILVATLATLLIWSVAPDARTASIALILVAMLHAQRLARWRGILTRSEPLVWVLHVAYGFVPLGAALMGLAIVMPDVLSQATALHVWTAGGIGLMTIAVMTRASLGHSGQALQSGLATTAIYLALIGSVFARFAADLWPEFYAGMLYVSAGLWIACFAGFAFSYGPMLIRPKPTASA